MSKNQITTVDVGTNSVKILQLEITHDGIVIVNFGAKSYPRQSAAEKISEEVIIDTLSQLIREKLFRMNPVAMAVSRHLVTVKVLSGLPASAKDEDIEKMIPMQAEAELPFPVSDAVYDAYNIQRSPEGISMRIVAAKRTSVQRYLDMAKEVGLKLKTIVPSTFATYAVVFDQFKDQLAGRSLAIADIGAGMTDICMVKHGRLSSSRSFALGGNKLTQAFEREYGLSFMEAEERKIAEANLQQTEANPLTKRWADSLAMEMERSFHASAGEETNGNIDSLWICGATAQIPGISDYLASKLGIEVRTWNPMQKIESHSLENNQQRGLAVGLGLGIIAAAGAERSPTVNANLLPKEIGERAEKTRRKFMVLIAAVAAALIVIGASIGFVSWRRSRAELYKDVADRLQKMEKKEEIRDAKTALENSILMQQMMSPYVSPLEVLREMSEKLPDRKRIALNTFSLDKKGKITMGVEASSHADVSEMIQTLSELEIMDDVKLFDDVKNGAISKVTKDKRPILQVQVVCTLNSDAMQGIK